MSLNIIYQDNHIIVIDKEPGELSQKDINNEDSLIEKIKFYLKETYNKKNEVFLGVIHRLDRVTGGLIIYAKTSKALKKFNELFKNKEIEKYYLAITNKAKENSNTLVHYLMRDRERNISKAFKNEIKYSKKAILHYEVIDELNDYSLLKIKLETGRHHQIRAQLKAENLIIRGDLKYGDKRPLKNKSIYLYAYKLSFIHPIKKEEIILKSYPNEALWNKFKIIKD